MLQVQKYIEYCMGFGYLNKKRYADDLAQQRGLERVLDARLDQLLKAAQTAVPGAQAPVAVPPAAQDPTRFQRLLQLLATPFQAVYNRLPMLLPAPLLNTLGAAVTTVRTNLEQALGKILSFFYGFKKEKTEEREKRDKDDFAKTDLFSRRTVDATTGGGHGGKR